jgi:hypothetical protein
MNYHLHLDFTFLRIMSKIPAPPRHHNEQMGSWLLLLCQSSAGIWRKASAMFKALEGRPSWRYERCRYLLNLHFLRHLQKQRVHFLSLTVPPLQACLDLTYTFLSNLISTVISALIITSFSCDISSTRPSVPRFTFSVNFRSLCWWI